MTKQERFPIKFGVKLNPKIAEIRVVYVTKIAWAMSNRLQFKIFRPTVLETLQIDRMMRLYDWVEQLQASAPLLRARLKDWQNYRELS